MKNKVRPARQKELLIIDTTLAFLGKCPEIRLRLQYEVIPALLLHEKYAMLLETSSRFEGLGRGAVVEIQQQKTDYYVSSSWLTHMFSI